LIKADASEEKEESLGAFLLANQSPHHESTEKSLAVSGPLKKDDENESESESNREITSSLSEADCSDDSDEVIFNKNAGHSIYLCKMEPEDKRQYLEECYDEYCSLI